MVRLFKFHNVNASSMRTIMIADCHDPSASPGGDCVTDAAGDTATDSPGHECRSRKSSSHSANSNETLECVRDTDESLTAHREDDCAGASCGRQSSQEYTDAVWDIDDDEEACFCAETQGASSDTHDKFGGSLENSQRRDSNDSVDRDVYCDCRSDNEPESDYTGQRSNTNSKGTNQRTVKAKPGDKYLIFTTGLKTYTPHQIGVKRIRSHEAEHKMNMPRATATGLHGPLVAPGPQFDMLPPDIVEQQLGANQGDGFDPIDHLIELNGHIIGMCLTPDHRCVFHVVGYPSIYVTGSTIMRNKSGHVNAGKTTSKFVGVIFH